MHSCYLQYLHSSSIPILVIRRQLLSKRPISFSEVPDVQHIYLHSYTIWLLYLVYEGYIVSQSQNSLESDPVSKRSGIGSSLKRVWNQTQSQKGLESDPVSKKSGPVSERFGSSFDSQPFFLLRIVMVPKVEQW